jgi:hypothetical protein
MTIELSHILSIVIPLLIFGLGFLIQQLTVISDLKARLSAAELKINVWWSTMEKRVAEALKAPTHLAMDHLLWRYQHEGPDSLQDWELLTLYDMVARRHQETMPGGTEPNPHIADKAWHMMAFIEARLAERKAAREQAEVDGNKRWPRCLRWLTRQWETCSWCQRFWTAMVRLWNWLSRF